MQISFLHRFSRLYAGLVYRYYSSFPSWLGGFDSRTLLHEKSVFCLPTKALFSVIFACGELYWALPSYIAAQLYCASRSFVGEYNITATAREQYNYADRHNITAARGGNITFLSGTRPIYLFLWQNAVYLLGAFSLDMYLLGALIQQKEHLLSQVPFAWSN